MYTVHEVGEYSWGDLVVKNLMEENVDREYWRKLLLRNGQSEDKDVK
jgi:hypothetical protein